MAVEEHLPLCQHLVVADAEQLRWPKTLLLKIDGGGGEVENPQPRNIKFKAHCHGVPFTLTGVDGRTERDLGGSRAAAGEGEEEGKEDKEGTKSWCRFCTGHFLAPFSLNAKLATLGQDV